MLFQGQVDFSWDVHETRLARPKPGPNLEWVNYLDSNPILNLIKFDEI